MKGSCSTMYPNDSIRHVFRCPKTWYVTGDVVPITKKVLKLTETAIRHDRVMNICIDRRFSYYFCLLVGWYTGTGYILQPYMPINSCDCMDMTVKNKTVLCGILKVQTGYDTGFWDRTYRVVKFGTELVAENWESYEIKNCKKGTKTWTV